VRIWMRSVWGGAMDPVIFAMMVLSGLGRGVPG
jgi:hypothetical protein